MSKRGKLSKVEYSYIESNYEKLSLGDLAKDLDRTQDSIKKAIKDLGLDEKPKEHLDSVYKGTKAGDLMGRKVRDGKVTTTVMTEAASERADERRKEPIVNKHTENAVCKPLGKGKFDDKGSFKKSN